MTPLKKIRTDRAMTVKDIASAVGVTQPTISNIENGVKRPSPELADRIAKFFANAVTRDQILFPEDYAAGGKKKAA